MMNEIDWQVRVYYEDTDGAGVVYHANYLKFLERGRTELLRSGGYSQEILRTEQAIIFAVTKMNLDFKRPARIDELLTINTKIIKTTGATIFFKQSITNDQSEIVCDAEVNVVCLNAITFKPQRLPNFLKAELEHVS